MALWECRQVALCRPRCYWLAGLLGQLAVVTGELLLLTEPFKLTRSRTARLLRAWSSYAQPQGISSERASGSLWILVLMLYVDIFCSDVEETCGCLCTLGFTQSLLFPRHQISPPPPLFLPIHLLLYSFSCVCLTHRCIRGVHLDTLPPATLKRGWLPLWAVCLTSHSCRKITPQVSFLQFHQQNASEGSFIYLPCLLAQIDRILSRYSQTKTFRKPKLVGKMLWDIEWY